MCAFGRRLRRRSFGWVLVGPTPTPNGTERGKLHRRCHARRVQFNHHQGVELIPASNDETKGGSSQIRSTERGEPPLPNKSPDLTNKSLMR